MTGHDLPPGRDPQLIAAGQSWLDVAVPTAAARLRAEAAAARIRQGEGRWPR